MRHNIAVAVCMMALAQCPAFSEVVDSASSGFTVRLTLNIHAAPADVYRKLVQNIGDWWSPQHTYSGNSHNLSIEEKPMGCFCEKLPGGGSVRHMEVVLLAPGKLGLIGALGPLQTIAATGNMSIQLTAAEGGSKLDVAYNVAGYLPAGMNTWAAPVDTVLTQQFTRLKNYVERGDPAPK